MSRAPRRSAGAILPVGHDALLAIDGLETELGGRTGLLAALALAPLTRDVQYFQGLLASPEYASTPLLELCRLADLQPGTVLAMIQRGLSATSSLRAQYQIATRAPAVVADVMLRGAPFEDACLRCQGTGSVTPDPTPDRPNPSPDPCPACAGSGRLLYQADPDCRKLALDLSGLLPKGGGIQITNQQLALASGGAGGAAYAGSDGDVERFQEAMDLVLFGGQEGRALAPGRQQEAYLPTTAIDVTPENRATPDPPAPEE